MVKKKALSPSPHPSPPGGEGKGEGPPTRSHAHTFARTLKGALPVILFIGLGFALYSPPYEYVLGNWDPGTYVTSGAHLARGGSIQFRDRVLAELAPADRPLFYYTHLVTQRYEGGMAIADSDRAIVSPHFYHLYTVWIALFHAIGGLRFSLRVNMVFGLLSLGATYLMARELAGRRAGFLAALFLGMSAAQIWSVRFPTAEILGQFMFLSGLFCLFRYQEDGSGLWGFLAGACFAEALLTVFTAVTVLPSLILILFWRNWERWRRSDLLLAIPLAAGLLHLALQDATVCRSYLERQLAILREQGLTPAVLTASFASFLLALVLARAFFRSGPERLRRIASSAAFRFSLGAALIVLFVIAYWVRPILSGDADARNLRELGWFVYPVAWDRLYFPLGLCLALAGAVAFIRRGVDEKRGAFLLVALLGCAALIHRKMIFPSYLWAVRRYIPLAFPALIAFMSYPLAALWRRSASGAVAAAAAALIMLSSMQLRYNGAVAPIDYAGTIDFLGRLAGPLDRGGLYICEGSGIASALDYLHGLDALQLSNQEPAKCRGVERVIIGLIGRGRRVYYISRGGWPISRSLNFVPIAETPFETDHLEYSVGAFPRKRVPVSLTARVFLIEPLGRSPEGGATSRMIDIGEDAFGLLSGFHGPVLRWEKENGRQVRRWARWTGAAAEVVIPTFGSYGDLMITLRATAGKDRPEDSTPVRLSIGGREVGEVRITRSMEEHTLTVSRASLPSRIAGKERAILGIRAPVWHPSSVPLSGTPAGTPAAGEATGDLGVCIDWIRVEYMGLKPELSA
jgi:4-amino-4-deoxy-L-arabinose transferase-like glycosyltransferase